MWQILVAALTVLATLVVGVALLIKPAPTCLPEQGYLVSVGPR